MDTEKMNLQFFIKICRSAREAESALELDDFTKNINDICTTAIDHYVRTYGKDAALARIEEVMDTIYEDTKR